MTDYLNFEAITGSLIGIATVGGLGYIFYYYNIEEKQDKNTNFKEKPSTRKNQSAFKKLETPSVHTSSNTDPPSNPKSSNPSKSTPKGGKPSNPYSPADYSSATKEQIAEANRLFREKVKRDMQSEKEERKKQIAEKMKKDSEKGGGSIKAAPAIPFGPVVKPKSSELVGKPGTEKTNKTWAWCNLPENKPFTKGKSLDLADVSKRGQLYTCQTYQKSGKYK